MFIIPKFNKMKKLLLLTLLISSISNAQLLKLYDKEQFGLALVIDPCASIKEKGLNIGVELEYVGQPVYVRASFTTFPALKGGYNDLTGAVGISLASGYYNTIRYYTGIRAGYIIRGGVYPTLGYEAGINVQPKKSSIYGGIRTTNDWRSDFDFHDGKAQMRRSGYILIGKKW